MENTIYSKTFFLICYLDYESIKQILFNIQPNYYAFIKHNKDFNDNGELEKIHYHIYLEFRKEHSLNKLAKTFKISPNLVEIPKYKRGVLQYLIHKNDKDKYQYHWGEVETNIENIHCYLDNNLNLNYSEYNAIVDYLKNYDSAFNCLCTFTELCSFIYLNGYQAFLQKNTYLVKCLYDDYLRNRY